MGEPQDRANQIVEWVSARAALAGNPSDGYGGAVFAVPVDAYRARAAVEPIESGWEVVDELSGRARFGTWSEVERACSAVATDSPHALVLASLASVIGRNGGLPPLRIGIETSIPFSVGLAGSSAIVIAVLRALFGVVDDRLPPDELASLALSIETDRLGITAGLQDRVVQSYGAPVLMRFDAESRRPLTGGMTSGSTTSGSTTSGVSASGRTPFGPRAGTSDIVRPGGPMRLLVAHRTDLWEPSQVVHGDLRQRFELAEEGVVAAMASLARSARAAAAAFESGDVTALGAAMDATFAVRASIIDLVPGHVAMVDAALASGAHANYTGSGGAVVVLCPDDGVEQEARQSLKRLGCSIVAVTL